MADTRRLRIAQISDTHLAPGQAEVDANFDALAAWIRAESPDLVVHSGDVLQTARSHSVGCPRPWPWPRAPPFGRERIPRTDQSLPSRL